MSFSAQSPLTSPIRSFQNSPGSPSLESTPNLVLSPTRPRGSSTPRANGPTSSGTTKNGMTSQQPKEVADEDVQMAEGNGHVDPIGSDDDPEGFVDAEEGEDEDDESTEGEGEEGVEGGEVEDEEEEDEEEEEEDDEESDDDDKSEDLEGGDDRGEDDDIEITKVNIVTSVSQTQVKVEPGTEPDITTTVTQEEVQETNILAPKRKKVARRSPSIDDMPPPPPPMITIRLEKFLDPNGESLEWNILEDARLNGMISTWPVEAEESKDLRALVAESGEKKAPAAAGGMEVDEVEAGPSTLKPKSTGLQDMMNMTEEELAVMAKEIEERDAKATKRRKPVKRRKIDDDYDTDDSFIDDSEQIIDAPTHMGRALKEGFFVQQGPVDLAEEVEATPKRKAQRRPRASQPKGPAPLTGPRVDISRLAARRGLANGSKPSNSRARSVGDGSRSSPIKLDSDDDGPSAGPSRLVDTQEDDSTEPLPEVSLEIDRGLFRNASKDPAYLPPFPAFPIEVRRQLLILKQQSDKHAWDVHAKTKFPEHLKPFLTQLAEVAFGYNHFGTRPGAKGLYESLPSVLPYNLFTLTKLINKQCRARYWEFLQLCEDTGIDALGELVEQEKEYWIRKYTESRAEYEQQLAEWTTEHPEKDPAGLPKDPDSTEPEAPAPVADGRPKEPKREFRWTPMMQDLLRQILENNEEMSDYHKKEKELGIAPTGKPSFSEKKSRSDMITKICELFPDGFATHIEVGKKMSNIKARRTMAAKEKAAAVGQVTANGDGEEAKG